MATDAVMVAKLQNASFRTIPTTAKYSRRLISLGCVLVSACVGVSGPNDYELPEADPNLDPAALQEPHLIYGCGQWSPEAPAGEKLFVDIAFIRRDEDDPKDQPSNHHLAILTKYGGEVAYKFHFPAVRAWISRAAIPGLAADKDVYSVMRIADLRRYDWYAIVGYRSRGAFNAGLRNFAELGGRIKYNFEPINAISGLIPDPSVAILWKSPDVQYVEFSGPIPLCKMQ